jgi:hypothetical protein
LQAKGFALFFLTASVGEKVGAGDGNRTHMAFTGAKYLILLNVLTLLNALDDPNRYTVALYQHGKRS